MFLLLPRQSFSGIWTHRCVLKIDVITYVCDVCHNLTQIKNFEHLNATSGDCMLTLLSLLHSGFRFLLLVCFSWTVTEGCPLLVYALQCVTVAMSSLHGDKCHPNLDLRYINCGSFNQLLRMGCSFQEWIVPEVDVSVLVNDGCGTCCHGNSFPCKTCCDIDVLGGSWTLDSWVKVQLTASPSHISLLLPIQTCVAVSVQRLDDIG